MNGLPYYKAYPRDFIEGTIGMPLELKGAYRVLLDLIYMQGGELPDDPHYICGLLGCSVRKWKILRQQLLDMGKIEAENEIISQKRARKELEILRKLQDTNRENRRRPNKNNDLATRRSHHTEPEPDIREDTDVSSLSSDDDESEAAHQPVDEIAAAVVAYNAAAETQGWPKVQVVSKARRAALAARLREAGGLDGWEAALAKARASPHCNGQNDRGWVASFDFLTRQSSFTKLMEGNYDNRTGTSEGSGSAAGAGRAGSAMAEAFATAAARRGGVPPAGGRRRDVPF